jgi:hypothetical protein
MLAQEVQYYVNHEINRNYKALGLVMLSKKYVGVEQALIATEFRPDKFAKKELINNYKRHDFTREDALQMAKFRADTGASYRDIAFKFDCSDGYAYLTMQKHGLIKK